MNARGVLGVSVAAAMAGVLLLGGSACGDSAPPADAASHDAQAGRAFLRAYEPYRALGGAEAERSIIQPDAARRACPAYPREPRPSLAAKLNEALFQASGIRQELSLVRPYIAFSNRVSRLRLEPRALQVVVRADAIVAAEVKHLAGARLDLCAFLTQWKAHDWSITFERQFLQAPFGPRHTMDRSRIRRASASADRAVPGLQRLGLTLRQALVVSSSARF